MANSKSNIYPIQLQGAELNLNKYDAEIKQYSGFNKNNSPFVGGCLSNVFTKEEQITGGNADNTYIDKNGNIYTFEETATKFEFVRYSSDMTERKVISEYDKQTIKHEKLDLPKNTVYFYDAGECGIVWATYDNTTFSIHYKKGETELVQNYEPEQPEPQDPTVIYKNVNNFFFNAKCHNNNIYISFVCHITKPYTSASDLKYGRLWFIGIHTDVEEPEMVPILTNEPCHPSRGIYKNTAILKDSYNNRIYFCLNETGSSNTKRCIVVRPSDFNILRRIEAADLFDITDLGVSYTTSTFFIADSVNDYGYAAYMTRATLDSNKIFYMKSRVQVGDENSNIYKIKILKDTEVETKFNVNNLDLNTTLEDPGFVMNNYGALYGVVGKYQSQDKEVAFGVCDELTKNVTVEYDEQNNKNIAVFKVGGIVSKNILFNNCLASGICSNKGILITEWNSVDKDYIFPQNEGELKYVYKNINDNKFYAIKFSSDRPTIRCFNNQLIFNIDSVNNSYNLENGELKTFAFAWNNRAILKSKLVDLEQWNGDIFFASAVNEYDLLNNSSLILNPIQVINNFDIVSKTSSVKIAPELSVNYYKGTEQILYYCSEAISKPGVYFLKDNLEGLPFPSNTDGNVQYSPSLFCDIQFYGNDAFVKEGVNTYQLMKSGNEVVFSYFLGTLIEGLELVFIIQGQYYGIVNNNLYSLQFNNGVISGTYFIVDVQGLQFVGNTPYEALFFSKTNRCLYSFTGANVLNQKQLVDKISEVRNYLYNPATQTVFLITDIGVLFYGLFGMFLLEYTNITNIFLLDNGIVMSDNSGNYRYIKYYLDEGDEGYTKENIRLETCFYGMNNEVVTINDCLYFRLFSEEHEEGNLKVSATTISLKGRQTEETTFKIKASDWDKITHTIYLRYQPKTQRGLGVSFSIDSPFKIASMSVGSQPDAVLVDKVSKGAITAPSVTTNNNEW